MLKYYPLLLLLLCALQLAAQQVSDSSFQYQPERPQHKKGKGPVVYIDEGHYNFHTMSGRYAPFARVLEADGYQVRPHSGRFNEENLKGVDILVIANALDSSSVGNWTTPTKSAFNASELVTLVNWVMQGGKLFLIADHMPFGGAAGPLAASFGVEYCNCFAMDERQRAVERFSKKQGNLDETPVTAGLDSIVTFTGSAFALLSDEATPLLRLKHYSLLSPQRAWQFEDDTPIRDGDSFYQLAYLSYGKGKLVFSGEAAMFTAQIAGGQQVGMNHPQAGNNAKLLLSLLHWLEE